MLDNTPNKQSKFRMKNWVEINDESRGTHNTNSQIEFKNSKLKSILWDYNDACVLAKVTLSVAALAAGGGSNDKEVIFKNFVSFTDCISNIEINSTQIDNAKDIDVIIQCII